MPALRNLGPVRTLSILLVTIAGCSLTTRKLTAKAPITAVAISDLGTMLAAGTSDGHIQIWDVHLNRLVREIFASDGPLNDLQFAPGGRHLAVANRKLSIFPTDSSDPPNLLGREGANYGTVRFSKDGRSILTINGRGEIAVIDIKSGQDTFRVCCSTIYGEVSFVDGDRKILAAGHWPTVWDRNSGTLLARLTPIRESMTLGPIAIGSDGTSVLMGSQDGRIHRWDLPSAKFEGKSPALTGYVTALAAQGASPWMAYTSRGEPLRLWNTSTGETRILREARPTSNLWFDNATHSTIFGTQSGEVEFWEPVTGRKLRTLPIQQD